MHLISSTSSPLAPYLMRAFLSRSGLGPSRSIAFLGRLWLSPCRLCQALLSAPPPPLVGFLARRPSAFSFSLPFQGLPVWARCVGVGALSFSFSFLRSPSCVPVKPLFISFSSSSHFHLSFIFTFISFVGALKSLAAAGRVCGTSEEM